MSVKELLISSGFILMAMAFCLVIQAEAFAQANPSRKNISTASIKKETEEFLEKEVGAHFADIKTLHPPPERVLGALTVGEFSWGSFMRALAAQADIGGNRTIAGKDTARAIAEMGLIEAGAGGKAFSQLYSTLALRHYGTDLNKNAVWQSLSETEKKEWKELLDPARFYDAKTRQVINLPENYLGVAARVAAMSFEMGVLKDRAFLDSVVERAAEQFTSGAIFSDDNPPTGRYDRYSNEYARYCWDAADIAGRSDIKEKLRPSLKEQMKLWWDLVSPAGYGYNWGRSQGLVSYLDTLEIAAFLGDNPEFRPAPLSEIAALYNQAWRWIRADYSDETHMFTVFAYGRGNYSYINPKREWQQTGTAFGKIILANHFFLRALEREKIAAFPAAPALADVARFIFFAKTPDKQLGVWLVRQGKLQFALPITVGPKPGLADYLPAPHGLPGFSAPVEEVYPSMVPFLTLADGKTYSASDGSDEIVPGADGRSLKTLNKRWARMGSKTGERFENGLSSQVEWRLEGNKLIRSETVTAVSDVNIREWKVAFPSTGSSTTGSDFTGGRAYVLKGREGSLKVSFKTFEGMRFSLTATGDGRLGKGVLGAIPLHVIAEATDIKLKKGEQINWELTLELLK
ncbi:MAG TPA: hypothetical protein VGO50_18165 [Pyrinomonadaceae bacterium]|nr:hypothetical protein [Pyrinomonadaceae bacterium]